MTDAASEAALREARQYWGYLFNKDKTPTDLLERLLSGIHAHIVKTHGTQDECEDATVWQMANFYGSVGGRGYASFFMEQESSQISFIYTSLGCPHSLQPASKESTFVPPSVPALKRKGYVSWQSIQILLGPEEHVEYLAKAVAKFNIIDPQTGQTFPKLLPRDAFPQRADEEMTAWFEQVCETLKQQEMQYEGRDYAAQARMNGGRRPAGSSGDNSPTDDTSGRPALFRRITRMTSPAVLKKMAADKSGALVGNVRHFWSPAATSRRDARDDYSEDDDEYDGPTSTSNYPSQYKYSSSQSNRRRADSTASEDTASSSEIVPIRQQRRPEPPRQRRSHEDRPRSGEYLPTYEGPRRHSSTPTGDHHPSGSGSSGSGFAPSREPLFATRVSQQMKPPARPSYSTDQRRPSLARSGRYVGEHVRHHSSDRLYPPATRSSGSYNDRGHGERRHSSAHDSHREWERSQGRDRDRDRDRSKERDRPRNRERSSSDRDRDRDRYGDKERPRIARYVTPNEGVSVRRYPQESYR